MEYFVTGGTGLIGTHVIEQLVDEGHTAVAATRSHTSASHLPDEAEVVEADITEKESLREPMRGVDGVFHIAAWNSASPHSGDREQAQRINVDGTRNVLELIHELDVPKGVNTSTTGVYGNTDGRTVDESYRPDEPGLGLYLRTKWRAHYEVARPLMDEGLPLVIVLPGNVYGPGIGDRPAHTSITGLWLQGDLPVIPRQFSLPFDHVDDIARGHILAMEKGKIGEEYIISNETRRAVELFEVAEELTGISAPRTVSSLWFKLLAWLMTPVGWITTLPMEFEPGTLRIFASHGDHVDNSKAKRELGIDPRPLEEGLRECLEWEMEQLGMDSQIETGVV